MEFAKIETINEEAEPVPGLVRLLRGEFTERSTSRYAAPVMVIPKLDGTQSLHGLSSLE